ncbi:MAG: hypothetical protein ACKOZY_00765 [Flavobacteriales bacterium]
MNRLSTARLIFPRILFFTLTLSLSVRSFAQDTLASRSAARELAKSTYTNYSQELQLAFTSWDAFMTGADRGAYKRLDSLLHDVPFLTAGMQVPIEVDRFYSYAEKNDARHAIYSLRLIRMSLEKYPITDAYIQAMARTMAPKAMGFKDFETAAKLYALAGASPIKAQDTPVQNDNWKQQVDSLQRELDKKPSSPQADAPPVTQPSSGFRDWVWAVMVLLCITWVVLILFARKSKRLRESLQVKLDAALSDEKHKELEKKMELVENEAYEFRKTAQATVEKLNGMDNARRRVLAAVDVLDEDITKGLEEMRQTLEAQKSSLKPTEYMAIHNANARFSSAIQQRILLLRDRLKAW